MYISVWLLKVIFFAVVVLWIYSKVAKKTTTYQGD